MTGEHVSIDEIIESWFALPELLRQWLRKALIYMVSIGVFIGGVMVVWGAIQWATNYGRSGIGREHVIKGIALIVLSLAPSFLAV